MMKQRYGLDRNNVLRLTPEDPWGVKQYHWNAGAKENSRNPVGNRQKSSSRNQLKQIALCQGHHRV